METRASVPTSSTENGGHLPHCQTPERREKDKITINNVMEGEGDDTRGDKQR